MKRTMTIHMDIDVTVPDAPDGTPADITIGLMEGIENWIAGMISHQADIITEEKNAEVVEFSYEVETSNLP